MTYLIYQFIKVFNYLNFNIKYIFVHKIVLMLSLKKTILRHILSHKLKFLD